MKTISSTYWSTTNEKQVSTIGHVRPYGRVSYMLNPNSLLFNNAISRIGDNLVDDYWAVYHVGLIGQLKNPVDIALGLLTGKVG